MVTVNLGQPVPPTLQIARANAIEDYAGLEHSLCLLLGHLLKIDQKESCIIFYNIINTRSRNKIISGLLESRHGNLYDAYWHGMRKTSSTPKTPGLFGLIRQLDERRNQIVHWTVVKNITVGDDGVTKHTQTLSPYSSIWVGGYKEISQTDLIEFSRKTDFVARSINMFLLMTDPSRYPTIPEPWREIFLKPTPYPPSDTHPLSRNYIAPEIPPQPSEA